MRFLIVVFAMVLSFGCVPEHTDADHSEEMAPQGEHGGRLFVDGDTSLELLIEEATGTPEFRAWVRQGDSMVPAEDVELTVTLDRLGEPQDVFRFQPVGEVLVGDGVVREPHSFMVSVNLSHAGRSIHWSYDSFEGRTQIAPEMAEKFGLVTAPAGPGVIQETVEVFGNIQPDPARSWSVQARFPGVIRSVSVQLGDRVRAGDELARIESDESLKSYPLTAPAGGVLVERMANAGEHTADRTLFRIVDQAELWAMFRVFPADRAKVHLGQVVSVNSAAGEELAEGSIDWIALEAAEDQSVLARVVLANPDGRLLPGMYLTGNIRVAEHSVDLAVKRSGLQQFRDFTVVYRRIGDLYEVRMLELGRQDEEWVEVLGGLNAGDVYVTENSYLVKADIDKDSAAHHH